MDAALCCLVERVWGASQFSIQDSRVDRGKPVTAEDRPAARQRSDPTGHQDPWGRKAGEGTVGETCDT